MVKNLPIFELTTDRLGGSLASVPSHLYGSIINFCSYSSRPHGLPVLGDRGDLEDLETDTSNLILFLSWPLWETLPLSVPKTLSIVTLKVVANLELSWAVVVSKMSLKEKAEDSVQVYPNSFFLGTKTKG